MLDGDPAGHTQPPTETARSSRLDRSYGRLWLSVTLSNLADGVVVITALPLLAASLSRDPLLVSGVYLAGRLPWILFGLVTGAVVDRSDRRRIMLGAAGARSLLVGAFATWVLVGEPSLGLVYATAFLLGTVETFFDTAALAVLPAVVPADSIEKGNAHLYSAQIIANEFAGPPLGGVLFGVAAALPFFGASVSLVAATVAIAALSGDFRARASPAAGVSSGIREEIAFGLRWLLKHRVLRDLAVMVGILNLFGTATLSVLVLYALQVLDLGNSGYGLLLGLAAVGSIVGSQLAAPISRRLGAGTTLLSSMAIQGAAFTTIGLTSSVAVTTIMLLLSGLATWVWNVVVISLRQRLTPQHLFGRVNAPFRLVAFGTIPLGAALGGFLARGFGLHAPYLVTGITFLALTVASIPRINNRVLR